SADTGPVDGEVMNPTEQVTSAVDRVSLSAADIAPGRVLPDAKDVPLLKLVAGNTYNTSRHMTGLIVTNSTVGTGSSAQRDAEVARVRLRLDDGDGVLEGPASDSVLSTGAFVGGRAVFVGFNWPLPPGPSRMLFV